MSLLLHTVAHGSYLIKARLAGLLSDVAPPLHYGDYHRGEGPVFHEKGCELALEGIVSKRADGPYAPGNRGLWVQGQSADCEGSSPEED
jgi:bifunctional non-homologous end joining protein LigD